MWELEELEEVGLHQASAAGAPLHLFHGKISAAVVARANQAKFGSSYLRTKLCNAHLFPCSLPHVCHPMFPLVRLFSFFQNTLGSLALPGFSSRFVLLLSRLTTPDGRSRQSFGFSQSLQSTRCYIRGDGWSTSTLALHALPNRCCCSSCCAGVCVCVCVCVMP